MSSNSSFSSLEGTLALAIKHYRVIVDSRRFIPVASNQEFKKVFDEIIKGILDSLPEAIININEAITEDNADDIILTVRVDAKNLSIATDILKILIILKHFINDPIYADQTLHKLFHLAAKKDLKVVSATSEFDDHKAIRRFETFMVNLYVLLSDDSSLQSDAKDFLSNFPASRLHTTLLDAAPRASQEEMYRKNYRQVLVNISDVNSEIINAIIKRLDVNYPEDQMIEGVTRKEFLLTKLGWKTSKIYNCADRIQKRFDEAVKDGDKEETFKLFGHFWILLEESKFVAPDECCSTLFIFPSECESFLKYVKSLSHCFSQLPINQSLNQAKSLNKINAEISIFVRKLVKAISTNYIHFERDLNNRNYQSSNEVLSKIVVELFHLSQRIHDVVKLKLKSEDVEPSVGSNKFIADFIQEVDVVVPLVDESSGYPAERSHTAVAISDHQDDFETEKDYINGDKGIPLWTIIIAIFCTIFGSFLLKYHFENHDDNQ